ncbi:hypothetical protein [Brachybacterium hainanense]|uniref:Uncharacterized protein n=1 Tax=Brachybacterium hainanense TaxID=1541174 RepID=A0ABV6RCM8_9MICO
MSRRADAEWAYRVRLEIEERKTGKRVVPWFERASSFAAAGEVDLWAGLGEESQDPGTMEPA